MILVIWTIYWYTIWYIFNFRFKPYGITYSTKPLKLSIFFLLSAMFPLFYILYKPFYSVLPILALMTVTILANCVLLLKTDTSTSSDRAFYITKSIEVLFQQLMFLVLVNLIGKYLTADNDLFLTMITALYFSLVHFPIIFVKKIHLRVFYIFMSLIGGMIFTVLISTYDSFGIIYSYLVHILFYFVMRSKYPEPTD